MQVRSLAPELASVAVRMAVAAGATALLPAIALAQAHPTSAPVLRQTWRTFIEDPRTREHRMELAVWPVAPGRLVGLAWYQETGCRGELTAWRPEDGAPPPLVRPPGGEATLWFREQASGAGLCGNGGTVALTVLRRDPRFGATLRWQRVGPEGRIWAEAEIAAEAAVGPTPAFQDLLREQLARQPAVSPAGSAAAGAGARAAPDARVPLDSLRQVGLGMFQGQLAGCAAPRTFELVLTERAQQDYGDVVQLEGRLRLAAGTGAAPAATPSPATGSPPRPAPPNPLLAAIDAPVEGRLRSATGQIFFNTVYEPPARSGGGGTDPRQWLAAAARALQRLQGSPTPAPPPGAKPPPPAGWRSLEITLQRDGAGRGWAGVVSDPGLDCREVTAARSDGTPSNLVRAPTEQELFLLAGLAPAFQLDDGKGSTRASPVRPRMRLSLSHLANPLPEPGEPWLGAPWLALAAEHGSVRAAALLGRALEHGLGLPADPARAAAWTERAAVGGDVEAQRALARRLEAGAAGLPPDPARAADLRRQADAREAAARRVCTAAEVVGPMAQLVLTGLRAQGQSLLNVVLSVAADRYTNLQVGAVAVERVDLVHAAGPERPFVCRISARRIDARVTDLTPYRQWAYYDRRGELEYLTDNADDLFLNRLSAQYQTLLMNRTPAVEHIEVAPLGPRRWRLTLLDADPLGTLPRRLYVDVDGP